MDRLRNTKPQSEQQSAGRCEKSIRNKPLGTMNDSESVFPRENMDANRLMSLHRASELLESVGRDLAVIRGLCERFVAGSGRMTVDLVRLLADRCRAAEMELNALKSAMAPSAGTGQPKGS